MQEMVYIQNIERSNAEKKYAKREKMLSV